jgi:hypothetical protein
MINQLGNKFYQGVVESRADPLKLGRCKVRIVGIHTENTALLPTKDLPWAYPLQPIISGAMSGIGFSPTGPVEGTWVLCIFRDEGSFQEPVMLGTLGGVAEEKEPSFKDDYSGEMDVNYFGVEELVGIEDPGATSFGGGVLRDSDGNAVLDGDGNPIELDNYEGNDDNVLRQIDAQRKQQTPADGSYKLGQVSSKYESRGDAGVINDYNGKAKGDLGGASYGKYQFASYMGANGQPTGGGNVANSPVRQFVASSSYAEEFRGLVPGTPAFDNKWREVAARDPKGFEEEQRQYVQDQYYTPASNNLRASGLDLSNRGPAVQEAIWSTSVQYGPGGANRIFNRALEGKDVNAMTDAEIVSAVQQDKLKNVHNDFRSSPSLHENLRNRIRSEERDLVALAGNDSLYTPEEIEAIRESRGEIRREVDPETGEIKVVQVAEPQPIPSSGLTKPRTIASNTKPGFQDPFQKYPREKWVKEQDTSRLARGEKLNETILRSKRESLIRYVGTAGGGRWSEPESKYKAEYPLNHVYQSESGHTTEFDDTPDAERIHIYHRMGSFIEWHPDGTVVYKSAKDQYEVTVKDRNIYVGGTCNITVEGNTNVYTKGVMRMESDGDMFIETRSNLRIGAMGTCHIESNRDMHVGSQGNIHETGRNIFMNCSWRPRSVSTGDHDIDTIQMEIYDDDEGVTVPPEEEAQAIASIYGGDPNISGGGNGIAGTGGGSGGGTDDGQQPGTRIPPTEPKDLSDVPMGQKDETKTLMDEAAEEEKEVPNCDQPNTPISSNYTLADVTTSTALSRTPVREQRGLTKCQIVKNLSDLSKAVLEPLRARFGNEFIITSGFRNCAPGSGSDHCTGNAVDIQFPGLSFEDGVHRAAEIAKVLPEYSKLIVEYHGRTGPVFHISHKAGDNARQHLSTPDLRNYFTGLRDNRMNSVYP